MITNKAEALSMLKRLTLPSNESKYDDFNCGLAWSMLIGFCLNNKLKIYYEDKLLIDFEIEQPTLYNFAYDYIRSWVIEYIYNGEYDGKVEWRDRTTFIQKMSFEIPDTIKHDHDNNDEIKKIFMIVSNAVESKDADELIRKIADAIENILTSFGRKIFEDIPESVEVEALNLTNLDLKEFRKLLHLWRHKTQDSIEKTKMFSDAQKDMIIFKGKYIIMYLMKNLNYIENDNNG